MRQRTGHRFNLVDRNCAFRPSRFITGGLAHGPESFAANIPLWLAIGQCIRYWLPVFYGLYEYDSRLKLTARGHVTIV
jgi:hypothetical protein